MKPAPFDYFAPATLDEALALLAEHGGDAKPLAGGQSLLPAMNFRLARPAVLVDLNRISELAYVRAESGVAIGAMTRQRVVERSDVVARAARSSPKRCRPSRTRRSGTAAPWEAASRTPTRPPSCRR